MKSILIIYDGTELTEYSATKIAEVILQHCNNKSTPIMSCLNDKETAEAIAQEAATRNHAVKVEVAEKPDTSKGDSALIYLAGKFKNEWNDPMKLLLAMSQSMGRKGNDKRVITSISILNDSSHPYQEEVARDMRYGETQKEIVKTIYESFIA